MIKKWSISKTIADFLYSAHCRVDFLLYKTFPNLTNRFFRVFSSGNFVEIVSFWRNTGVHKIRATSLYCSNLEHPNKIISTRKLFSPKKKFHILTPSKTIFLNNKNFLCPRLKEPIFYLKKNFLYLPKKIKFFILAEKSSYNFSKKFLTLVWKNFPNEDNFL